ncbi:MAG: phosphatase PAP2 family protein [Candidatus Pacebacteria bacterium]|nr:phosphatase PAP2 family protein [Candidatus Paceibacterota bacterium]MDD5356915.1 phosphatase PAP2 family protein [Candidatus Paceibacterota bacterium]
MTTFGLILLCFFLFVGYISIYRRKDLFTPTQDRIFFTHLVIIVLFIAVSIVNAFHLVDSVNVGVHDFLQTFWNSSFDTPMIMASFLASPETLAILSCLLLIVLHFRHERTLFFFTFISLVGALVSNLILKDLFKLVRPAVSLIPETFWSFPSGHSTMIVVFLSCLYYCWTRMYPNVGKWKKQAALFAVFLLSLLVGFSRLYLGVHWLSDVVAGFLLGLFWVTFAYLSPRPKSV